MYKNNQPRERDLYAELSRDSDGSLLAQPLVFKIFRLEAQTEVQEEHFRKFNTRNFELSLTDNRMVKLQLYDSAVKSFIENRIVFSNVHKKNQFAELFNIEELTPGKLARVPGILSEELRQAVSEPGGLAQDEREAL